MSLATDLTGQSAAGMNDSRMGSATGIKNIALEFAYSFRDLDIPYAGKIRHFIGTADPTTDDVLLNDSVAPLGSQFTRILTFNATTGEPEAAELYVKTVKASAGVSGFKKVTTAA